MASVISVYKEHVYIGEYELNGEELIVKAGDGSKKDMLNGAGVVELAREMLLQLVKVGCVQPELAGPILIKDGLRVFEITPFSENEPEISSSLVSGPYGALHTYASRSEAEAYIDSLHLAKA